jgi:hypothetical protein
MPLKRIKTRLKLLRDITTAIQEARQAGVKHPLGVVKKVFDARKEYKKFKANRKE